MAMSELTTYANPAELYGQPIRMVIDEQKMTWWSLDDLVMATTEHPEDMNEYRESMAIQCVEKLIGTHNWYTISAKLLYAVIRYILPMQTNNTLI
jgi:hypothetical protein|tara:strand:- start:2128 stop:2412 length:285 start_codon:yes stop_codon:yes gene_type:complete